MGMGIPVSENYTVSINGRETQVYHTKAADFAVICFSGSGDITIKTKRKFNESDIAVRPLRNDYKTQKNAYNNEITLRLSSKDRVSVEPYGLENPLFILCAEYIEKPADATHIFKRGTFTEIERTVLKSGDCVYIEEGAVVTGCFFADGAKDITITGNGIIWGLPMLNHPTVKKPSAFLAVECENVKISGITAVESATWTIVPTACKNVEINGINIIASKMSSDGVDVVGCENVTISHCFICVNDDCIAVKAVGYFDARGKKNVKNISVSDCVFWKLACGNAVEIGYETSCEEISDITFANIDIIHCQYEGWQSGGVFTIHNGDRAHVRNVTYKNIYVEDAREKLIDFKILSSKYSVDKERGKVSDITFDGIYVLGDVLPPSILRGCESEEGKFELITNVTVRNLFLNGEKIRGRMNAHVIAELSRDIVFEE